MVLLAVETSGHTCNKPVANSEPLPPLFATLARRCQGDAVRYDLDARSGNREVLFDEARTALTVGNEVTDPTRREPLLAPGEAYRVPHPGVSLTPNASSVGQETGQRAAQNIVGHCVGHQQIEALPV